MVLTLPQERAETSNTLSDRKAGGRYGFFTTALFGLLDESLFVMSAICPWPPIIALLQSRLGQFHRAPLARSGVATRQARSSSYRIDPQGEVHA